MITYRKIFCWLYTNWLAQLGKDGSVLVRTLDFVIGSHCKYCMSARGILLGAGLALLTHSSWYGIVTGLVLLATVAAMTIGERSGWCELPDEDSK